MCFGTAEVMGVRCFTSFAMTGFSQRIHKNAKDLLRFASNVFLYEKPVIANEVKQRKTL